LLKALRIKGFASSGATHSGGVYFHTRDSRPLALGSLRKRPDLGVRSGITVDAENQWQNRAVIEAESCDAMSRTGSEEMILAGDGIKVTTGVMVTHVKN